MSGHYERPRVMPGWRLYLSDGVARHLEYAITAIDDRRITFECIKGSDTRGPFMWDWSTLDFALTGQSRGQVWTCGSPYPDCVRVPEGL